MKTCPNCNAKLNNDSRFCSGCGFHFEEVTPQNNASSSKNPLKGLLIGLIVALIILSMAISGFIWWNQPAKRVHRLLKLGEKYLAELDYDKSIITLEKALRIDPKNSLLYSNLADVYVVKADQISDEEEKLSLYETANENYANALYYAGEDDTELVDAINEFYLGWAQIYLDRNDYETAKSILKQGFDITEQEALENKIDEIEEKRILSLRNENARAVIGSITTFIK